MNAMQNSSQRKFILTPIANILQDTVTACNGIGRGIETQALGEYVLQTTFLKMTGSSEQKLKCICWEMATNDYDYRYRYLRKNYGECSSYEDKSSIYKDLVDMIVKLDPNFSASNLLEDVDINSKENELIERIIKDTQKKQEGQKGRKLTDVEAQKLADGMRAHWIKKGLCERERANFSRIVLFESMQDIVVGIIGDTLVAQWDQHNYLNYVKSWKGLASGDYALGDMLLGKSFQNFYTDVVYKHRNRCAHNLASYQNNLPTLKTLINPGFVYDNYYNRFSMIILLDEIFVRLYKKYLDALGQ